MKRKWLILLTVFLLLLCLFLLLGTYAKYKREIIVSKVVQLTVTTDLSNYIKVYYHSYDEDGNTYIYKTDYFKNYTEYVTILEQPQTHTDKTFLGWTTTGVYIAEAKGNTSKPIPATPLYQPGDSLMVMYLLQNDETYTEGKHVWTSNKEVHMFDMYAENEFVVEPDPNCHEDDIHSAWFNMYVYHTSFKTQNYLYCVTAPATEDSFGGFKNGYGDNSDLPLECVIHPGLYVRFGPGGSIAASSSNEEYESRSESYFLSEPDENGHRTREYETQTYLPKGNEIYYVGASDIFWVVYHWFDNGTYYERSYQFYRGDTVTLFQNQRTDDSTFYGWSPSGLYIDESEPVKALVDGAEVLYTSKVITPESTEQTTIWDLYEPGTTWVIDDLLATDATDLTTDVISVGYNYIIQLYGMYDDGNYIQLGVDPGTNTDTVSVKSGSSTYSITLTPHDVYGRFRITKTAATTYSILDTYIRSPENPNINGSNRPNMSDTGAKTNALLFNVDGEGNILPIKIQLYQRSPYYFNIQALGLTKNTSSSDDNYNYSYKKTWTGYTVHTGTNANVNADDVPNNNYVLARGSYAIDLGLNKVSATTEKTEKPCFASGTLITLADGSQKKIEDLLETDLLRAFDHETGQYISVPIMFIEYDGIAEYQLINLKFSNGVTSRIIYEHAFFDLTLNEYVYVTAQNYASLIGHEFAVEQASGFARVTLEDAYLTTEETGCYSLATVYHLNHFVDGMFSMPGGCSGLFNYFEYDPETLAYDEEKMQADIEKYGLYTYEDFEDLLTPEVFYEIYPVKYLKVSVAKGMITQEDFVYIVERYLKQHGIMPS